MSNAALELYICNHPLRLKTGSKTNVKLTVCEPDGATDALKFLRGINHGVRATANGPEVHGSGSVVAVPSTTARLRTVPQAIVSSMPTFKDVLEVIEFGKLSILRRTRPSAYIQTSNVIGPSPALSIAPAW